MNRVLRYLSHGLGALALGLAGPLCPGIAHGEVCPEDTLRAVQTTAPIPLDLVELATQYARVTRTQRVANYAPPNYPIGRQDRFWVARSNPPEYFQAEADLRFVGRHAYWYVQRGFSVSDNALRESATVFDTKIYPQVRRLVGSEAFPGIDNDPRVTIFNGDVPGVAAYVASADSYPRSVHPYSNEREIIYLNLRVSEPGAPSYYSTLAHEFTHLVHWNVNPTEDTWVKEGLAQLVASRVVGDGKLSSATFASAPDIQLTSWAEGEGQPSALSAHYEAASWFLRYVLDRFGEDQLYSILAQDARGPGTFDAFLAHEGLSLRFPGLFGEWGIANLVGKRPSRGIQPYASQPPEAPRLRRLSVPGEVQDTVAQFGTDYYELLPATNLSIRFAGATTVPVVGAPPGGGPMWYGGRADASASTMTRIFDLSEVEAAALLYRVWYDIEGDYDFAYVSTSADGNTWRLQETPRMSRANPTGNNLGVGYTGRSGEGPEPAWIQERIDLSPYIGGSVWIRFSYVTDEAFAREGIVLDDIRVEAPGSAEEAMDEVGWTLQGWARVGAPLPQIWSVRAIEYEGDPVRVLPVPIDAAGHGTWSPAGRRVDRVVLAVSGATPVTLQRADYQLSAERTRAGPPSPTPQRGREPGLTGAR